MNLYVSNLGYQISEEDLRQVFSQYGVVSSAKVTMDSFSGESRGFAFVEMPDDADATKAIEQLNNSDLKDRKISVQQAKVKEEKKGSYPARSKDL
jgi:RNA recognition motif-containing protein